MIAVPVKTDSHGALAAHPCEDGGAPPAAHRAFEAAARARPGAPAAVFGARTVSYGELNARANRLARVLRRAGVTADARVGIVMERAPELAAALLAVLKAGGAYVPVEPEQPAARVRELLDDAGAVLVLTERGAADRIPDGVRAPVLHVDWDGLADGDAEDLDLALPGESLAYVVFTSGSTGRPKGVGITHAGLAEHIHSLRDVYRLGPDDRSAQVASLGFDLSVEDIYPLWAAGGCVVFRPADLAAYGRPFGRWLEESGVTFLNLPTAFWHAWIADLAAAGDAFPPSLHTVVIGGERALPHVWDEAARLSGPSVRWINSYGPTEATVAITWHERADDAPEDGRGDVPIGLPLPDGRVYLVDADLRAVESGEAGELAIGGGRVARGYLGMPAATAERFRPDPFSGVPGSRMYLTGDSARWPQGGEVEFRGRRDGQVKVGGFRVEVGEVEAALAAHPGVSSSAVVAREDGGRRRLAGYWVPASADIPSEGELRAWLARRLPSWMVPASLTRMDALPLSANGKVDRRALPAPDVADGDWLAPRTPAQQMAAEVWSEVLGTPRVGEDDDFFALGGHSLLGMQVLSRLRQLLGVDLPVRALFESPTLAAFAETLERAMGVDAGPGQPPLVAADRAEALPLSFAQQRLWFLHQLEPDSPFYNIPASVRLEGALDVEALRRTLEEIVRRHEALRTVFLSRGGEPVQVVASAEPFDLPVADLSALPEDGREDEVARMAKLDAERRFDLARDPMLRASLLRLGAESHVLLLNLHHVAGDGWSLGVLFHEIGVLYAAYREGRHPELPPLSIQYADYAVWQRRWLTDEALDRQLGFWRDRLGSAPPVLDLPTDHARPAVQTHRGGILRFRFSRQLADRLHALARAEGATLYMTLLAALDVLLHRWSGQDDVVVGSPIAGRVRRELEGLIGYFANTMALRTDLSGDPSFREVLRRVREATLDAYAHQDLPFERVVEELQPERSLSRSPVFQVSLVLQNAPTPPLRLEGLTLRLQNRESGTAKFDLAVEFTEDADGLAGEAEYAADLWDESTVARMIRQLEHLLGEAAADPSLPIRQLAILPADEDASLSAWADGGDAVLSPAVHEAFALAAARVPEAVALVAGERRITFRELDARSSRAAEVLRTMGVGADARVCVLAGRTPEAVAALLAILKAGGAYVPLDPRHPRARIASMIRQSGASLIVADGDLVDRLPQTDARVVDLAALWVADSENALSADAIAGTALSTDLSGDSERSPASVPDRAGDADRATAIDPPMSADLPKHTDADTLAYVIFTSGSTGEPKGVAVPHGSLSAYLGWATETYPSCGAPTPVHSPFSFDLTVTSLWVPLLRGDSVALVADEEGPGGLAAALAAHPDASLAKLTPTHLSLLRNQRGEDAGLGAPRALVVGGESLEGEVASFWAEHAPETRIYNEYGPTEATVGCSVHLVAAGESHPGSVPIGRPVPGTRLHVLDADGRIAPIGVPGELYIGGAQLARGYLGRPGSTAAAFVPDPFSATAGSRLYRTGDRARWRADGELEFLGRLDGMVKIRGYRIEPGEIEAVLTRHPDVSDAAVDVRPDAAGEPRLVGYVVPAPEPEEVPSVASPEADAQVTQWEAVFEGMYGSADAADVTFDLRGWSSSYTGAAIPEEEMREWVESTADRILSLQPKRVLELGVGSGLFLFRVAPHAELYVGADLSTAAIARLSEALPASGLRLPPVRLMARPADDLSGLDPRSFDTVILNSVVQYFPSPAYLARVLEGAVERVADGGAVFIGDVRSLATLPAFHAATESARIHSPTPAAELRARMARRMEDEEELVIDPRFFHALQTRIPRLSRVDVRVKRGAAHNELTRHRYDVVLHVGDPTEAAIPAREVAWGAEVDRIGHLRAILAAGAPLRVMRIPDARVLAEVRLADAARTAGPGDSVDDLRAVAAEEAGVDPEALHALGASLGMRTELRPSTDHPGHVDAAFLPAAMAGRTAFASPEAGSDPAAWARDPRRGARIRRLAPALRAFLRDHLPEYMVPQALVVLDALPVTENGKADRRALPDPPQMRAVGADYTPPVGDTEERLCALWGELLRVDRVGTADDFFELGGHSLLATVLVSRVRDELGVELPLHRVFQAPTVAGMAAAVDEANEQVLARLLAELDEITDDEARALLAHEAPQGPGVTP